MHSFRMQNALSTRKNQNQHSAYYPLCVYSHMYVCIYIYRWYPLEGKPIPKTLQNCPFKTIPKNRHETLQIPVKVMRRQVFFGGYHIYMYNIRFIHTLYPHFFHLPGRVPPGLHCNTRVVPHGLHRALHECHWATMKVQTQTQWENHVGELGIFMGFVLIHGD